MKAPITTLCIILFYVGYGQLQYNNADRNFENLFYVKAAAQYERIIQRGDHSQAILQRVGDAYFFNTDMQNAAKWYSELFAKYEDAVAPEYAFRYIHALKGIGNYRLAKALMKVYSEKPEVSGFTVAQLQDNDLKIDELLAL